MREGGALMFRRIKGQPAWEDNVSGERRPAPITRNLSPGEEWEHIDESGTARRMRVVHRQVTDDGYQIVTSQEV